MQGNTKWLQKCLKILTLGIKEENIWLITHRLCRIGRNNGTGEKLKWWVDKPMKLLIM